MDIKIGDKEYKLSFGLGFIAELDKVYTIKQNGVAFAMGVETAIFNLSNENPTVLFNIFRAGTAHLNSRPSNKDIESTLEAYAEKGNLSNLFREVFEAMENSVFLKPKIKKVMEVGMAIEQERA